MNYTELIISFGDTQKLVLNSATQDGLVIKETAEMITIKFIGEDPSFYVNQLERFRNRGIVITAKRDNDPRRNIRGALTSLDSESATILIGKYPVGLDIDAPQYPDEAPVETSAFDSSLVSQLLAKIDEQNATIQEYQTKNQPIMAEMSQEQAGFYGYEQKTEKVDDRNLPVYTIRDEAKTELKSAEAVETPTEVAPTEVTEQVEAKPESTTTKKTSKKA